LTVLTKDVFIALNLSLMAAQSARGLPDIAITLLTMLLDLGMMASKPALAAPAPGPNLENYFMRS
jgi:hypothetical protein